MRLTIYIQVLLIFLFLVLWEHNCKVHNIEYSSDSTDLEVIISCDKTEFIQGESIDVFLKITNHSTDTIHIQTTNHIIYNLSNDSTSINQIRSNIILPPTGKYYGLIDPSDYLVFGGIDFSTNTLKHGKYSFYLSLLTDNNIYSSNKLNIVIDSVPDSLKESFNELKSHNTRIKNTADLERLALQHEGTFYEQQFYFKLLQTSSYYCAVQGKKDYEQYRNRALQFYKEFILEYYNTSDAYLLFKRLMKNYDENKVLIGDILTSLKRIEPESHLLTVLRNQPDYINKQIKHLLN